MDFRQTSVVSLAEDIRSGRLSARELTQAALDNIDRLDGELNCFCAIDEERALEDAALVDAAIAKPLTVDLVKDEILKIGKINGTAVPKIGLKVQKTGRTTGYTTGNIEVLNARVKVQYEFSKTAIFENQIIVSPMSQGGDSGSVVLDMDNNLIGLLFAGSEQTTILNPINKVFELLNVKLK